MKLSKQIAVLALVGSLMACVSNERKEKGEAENESAVLERVAEIGRFERGSAGETLLMEKGGLRLLAYGSENSYEDAKLSLVEGDRSYSEGMNILQFEVENFQLAEQTNEAIASEIANSEKGQHIHYIHNNGPYSAHYTSKVEAELSEGNNVILAFLSRSFHESIKSPTAFVYKNLIVGENTIPYDISSPTLIYSRPKGSYKGKINKVLVDFYLLNAELSKEGMKVRLTINDVEFILDSWQPYLVEGLSEGSHSFRIQLIDQDGKVIPGPFNDSGERIISLEK